VSAVRSKVLMVGLPQSGKTTFLAALWHIVQEAGVSASLRLKELRGDRAYLNRIRDAWLSCKPLERTTIQNEQVVTLWLQSQAGAEVELTIPDLSGEAFELQLRERRWPAAFDTLVNDASGILLFIHPDAIRAGRRVDFAKSLEAQLRRPSGAATSSPVGPALQAAVQIDPVMAVEVSPSVAEPSRQGSLVSPDGVGCPAQHSSKPGCPVQLFTGERLAEGCPGAGLISRAGPSPDLRWLSVIPWGSKRNTAEGGVPPPACAAWVSGARAYGIPSGRGMLASRARTGVFRRPGQVRRGCRGSAAPRRRDIPSARLAGGRTPR
jgi:hypothetical protein